MRPSLERRHPWHRRADSFLHPFTMLTDGRVTQVTLFAELAKSKATSGL